MASPFAVTSVSNYNSNPPSDDGAQNTSNQVKWSTIKTKLPDPIKTAFDSSESTTLAAFGKVIGGGSITTTGVNYTVQASDQGKLVKATASGITITTPDATSVGSPFVFGFLNNSSGDITFDGNGSQTVDGDLLFTVPAGCGLMLDTDGSNWFTFGRDFNNQLSKPQGYLTLTSGTPVITGDVTAATSIFYTPDEGDRAPISTDGATFKMRQFSELTLALVSNHLASTIYDVFLFDNSGAITIGTGPAWNNSGAGTGARGTGAGTTELQRVHGLLTNKNSMTIRNGSTTYTVAANQGMYVGSILIDSSAGQISCHRSYGQSRTWSVWNRYNRKQVILKVGDNTASWTYNSSTIRVSNNNSANNLTWFTGLPEEIGTFDFIQRINNPEGTAGATATIGIGYNSTTAFSGTQANTGLNTSTNTFLINFPARYIAPPALGINTITALEAGNTNTVTFAGAEAAMLLTGQWRA